MGWTENMVQLMATRKHRAYRKTSAGDPLKQVTPSYLLQGRDGFTDSGLDWNIKMTVDKTRDHSHIIFYYNTLL